MGPELKTANIIWRMAVGAVDGALTTSCSLMVAWSLGLLPGAFGALHAGQMGMLATHVGETLLLRALLIFLYDTTSVAFGGQTVGCRLFRLRIVSADGARVSVRNALKRAAAGGLVANTPVVGQVVRVGDYAAALFGRRRQAVRDRVAGTLLVHAGPPRWSAAEPACDEMLQAA
jgi:uncharacterized RDD family membrane protein YckC